MKKIIDKNPVAFSVLCTVILIISTKPIFSVKTQLPGINELLNRIAPLIISFALLASSGSGFSKKISPDFKNLRPVSFLAIMNVVLTAFFTNNPANEKRFALLLTAAAIAFLTALAEEIVYRKIPSELLKEKRSAKKIAFFTAIVFSLSHAANFFTPDPLPVSTFTQIVYTFLLGVFFAALFLKNGNLLPSLIAHFVLNFSSNLYLIFEKSATDAKALTDTPLPFALFTIALALPAFFYALKLLKKIK